MAKNNNLTDFLKGIADKLRSVLGTSELIDPQDFETKIDTVYQKGKQTQTDAFWESAQKTSAGALRTDYSYAFAGAMWNDETYSPKYNIAPSNCSNLFFHNYNIIAPFKCVEYPNAPITIDTSKSTNFDRFIYDCSVKALPTIDTTATTRLSTSFSYAVSLKTIDKLILKSDGSQTFSSVFQGTTKLENIVIEGLIGQNGFDVSPCIKLTHDSLLSIINALKDYSGTTTPKTVTLGATNLAKLTDAEKATATEKGWTLS